MRSLLRDIYLISKFQIYLKSVYSKIDKFPTNERILETLNLFLPLEGNIGLVLFITEFAIECKRQNINCVVYIDSCYGKKFRASLILRILNKYQIQTCLIKPHLSDCLIDPRDYIEGLKFEKTLNWRIFLKSKKTINNFKRLLFIRLNSLEYIFKHEKAINNKWILPSGSAYSTKKIIRLCQDNNIPFLTFDSGFGSLSTSINGIAAHNTCGINLIKKILDEEIVVSETILKESIEYYHQRLTSNPHSFQITPRSENSIKDTNYILILLNIDWDSAALLQGTLAENQYDSVLFTAKWIIDNTNYNLIIRRHPDERYWWGENKVPYEEISKISSRISVIDPNEIVNTYDIIDKAEYVIGWSTSALLESKIMGKKVFALAESIYTILGIVPMLNAEVMIFGELSNAYEQSKNKLKVILYLIQIKGWIKSSFTPQDIDLIQRLKQKNKSGFDQRVFKALTNFDISYIEEDFNNY